MSRFLYSNLLKITFGSLLMCILVPSLVFFFCSLLINKLVNIPSLILIVSCVVLWIILLVSINILNKKAKNKIVFEKDRIWYKGKTICKNNLSIKYFEFYISIIEPSLVLPKLHINGDNLFVTCYFSKKDIKKIKNLGYEINRI